MTLNDIVRQIKEYKREYGYAVGDLRVFLSGWPADREVESIALCDSSADEDDVDDDAPLGSFTRAEIVG